jgi:hypothetical protein
MADARDGDRGAADGHASAHRVMMTGRNPAGTVGTRTDRHVEHRAGQKVPDRKRRNFTARTPETIDGVTKTAARPHFW